MKFFVLPSSPFPDGTVRLNGEDYHYLVKVRRLKAGVCFDAVLPDGMEIQVKILSTAGKTLVGKCLGETKRAPSSPPEDNHRLQNLPPLALFQGLPKGSKMDLIIRQAAEGGLSIVAPFESEHSVVRLDKIPLNRQNRWERIAREARQQSGSALETKVLPPCKFNALLEYWESLKKVYSRPVGILLHQEPLAKGSFHDYLGKTPDFVALAVGPEGGFSPDETSRFLAAGWKPAMMGNTVLRTETAALYGAAAIRIILLESKTWAPYLKE